MELQILVSKKGTQVITTSNLHSALQLPDYKYNTNVENWFEDIYAFKDDVRCPLEMKDYAVRKMEFGKHKDYYISLEMARLITLNSSSSVKQKVAKHILSLEGAPDTSEMFSKDQIMAVLEITKVMGLVSCQKRVEEEHQAKFAKSKDPKNNYEWWRYRARLLGYSVTELKAKMNQIGKTYKGKSLRAMLMYLDKCEIIRLAVVELLIALGRPEAYAKNMGDLAKVFAKEMNIEIWDDRNSSIDFVSSNINTQLLQDVKSLNKGNMLHLL